jgi:peptidoglycan/LPS O-acetylase OafA/YrhL
MNTTTINAELQTRQQAARTATTNNPTPPFDRRHDLDALRAIAMLLGIVLHAALSFAPIPSKLTSVPTPLFVRPILK